MKKTIISLLVALMATTGTTAQTYTVQFSANGNTVTRENITLPYTIKCENAGNGELDNIIQGLYNFSLGGHYYKTGEYSVTGGNGKVTADIEDENLYITISAPFVGAAKVTGWYNNFRDYNHNVNFTQFTLTISFPGYGADPDVSGITWNTSANNGTFNMPGYDVKVETELWYKLSETANNSALADKTDVFLERTLNNSTWCTFCAPFDIVIPTGWTVKEFNGSDYDTGTQTLTLDFENVTNDKGGIKAGRPYLVKADVKNPTFEGVTQDWTYRPVASGIYATFVPVLTPRTLNAGDRTVLYLGSDNTLYYPSQDVQVKGFRAYFQLYELTAGDVHGARAFVLNFGDEATGIQTMTAPAPIADGGTYSLDGRKVAQPTRKGIYIMNGKKVVVK